jgi:NADH-quinone oxidoreductase subunit H
MEGGFWIDYAWPAVLLVIKIVAVIVPVILAMAWLTYAERKVIAAVQLRKGPNVVGWFGLLQPIADGVKLIFKETVIPSGANKVVFIIAPLMTFVLALVGWAVIPFGTWDGGKLVVSDINVGILYLFAISSLGVYGIIMSGWASNSRYAFLGGLRSAAQMVSYEVSIGFVLITVLLCAGSLNLSEIVIAQKERGLATLLGVPVLTFLNWYWLPLLPMFVIFFISALAETNRHPFDLPEAEAELVTGYNVEYSAFTFALFFLGEYMNMILMSAMTSILFLGGWLPPLDVSWLNWIPGPIWLALKISFFLFLFILARAAYPRYRYDQLMRLGWKVFLPLTLLAVVFYAGVLLYAGWLPQ